MKIKWFQTQNAAKKWADAFAYARRLCGLKPLVVVPDDDMFAVDNPDFKSLGSTTGRWSSPRRPSNTPAQIPYESTVKVPSKSKKGKFYSVVVREGKAVFCPCAGFKYRNRCDHLGEAETVKEGRR